MNHLRSLCDLQVALPAQMAHLRPLCDLHVALPAQMIHLRLLRDIAPPSGVERARMAPSNDAPRVPAPIAALLLQVVPILVFLVVDALVQSPEWAIAAALAFVAFQALVNLVRRRPFDRFLLLDLALIGGMGAASLITRSEVFFKLKPAVLEGVMVPFLAFLALAPERILAAWFARYSLAPGAGPAPAALPTLRRLLGLMALLILAHAGLTVWAALAWSRASWAAVSGPGFYAILVPVAGYVLHLRLRARRLARAAAAAPEPPRPTRVTSRRRRTSRAR
jgi:hypothetical protein